MTSQKIEMYDAEDHRPVGLAEKTWPIADIGGRVWLTLLYICKRKGGRHQLDEGSGDKLRREVARSQFGVLVFIPDRAVRASPLDFAVRIMGIIHVAIQAEEDCRKSRGGWKRRSETGQRTHTKWDIESIDHCERVTDAKGTSSGFYTIDDRAGYGGHWLSRKLQL